MMDNNELKEALATKKPVVLEHLSFSNIDCGHVSALIYRMNKDGRIRVSAEITDANSNSVVIADPKKIRFKEAAK